MTVESEFSRTITSHGPETVVGRKWSEASNTAWRATRRSIKVAMVWSRGGTETAGTPTVIVVVVHGRIGETRMRVTPGVTIVVAIVVVVTVTVFSVPIQFGL